MQRPYRRGLVALSADPVTYGHLDIIERAAERCDELVVLVAENERKRESYLFDLEERRAMTERAVDGRKNFRVVADAGLLIDVILREHCDAVFRGVRDAKDRDYEEEQLEINGLILPAIKDRFVYLESKPDLRHVSSTLVKAFVTHGLDVEKLVPVFVKQALEERLLGQFRLGVTGSIAVGKSWVAEELCRQARADGIPSRHVNVDALLRELYDEDSAGAQDVRDKLAGRFGDDVLENDGRSVARNVLADRIFGTGSGPQARDFVVKLTFPHVQRLYRKAIAGAEGLVVVEWAQMAEMRMGSWTNHNVVVVDSPDRLAFAEKRGIGAARLAEMSRFQWDATEKVEALRNAAREADSGRIRLFENFLADDLPDAERLVRSLYREVALGFPGIRATAR